LTRDKPKVLTGKDPTKVIWAGEKGGYQRKNECIRGPWVRPRLKGQKRLGLEKPYRVSPRFEKHGKKSSKNASESRTDGNNGGKEDEGVKKGKYRGGGNGKTQRMKGGEKNKRAVKKEQEGKRRRKGKKIFFL